MLTTTTTYYTIDEHPNKELVFDHVRATWHDLYGWGEDNVASLTAFCEHFSLSAPEYCIDMGGYSFASASINSELENLKGARLWIYLQNSGLVDAKLLECLFTGYCFDESLLDPIRAFIAHPDNSLTYQELIDDCLQAWVTDYIADWEYTYTDEAIEETLAANEYHFNEKGELL